MFECFCAYACVCAGAGAGAGAVYGIIYNKNNMVTDKILTSVFFTHSDRGYLKKLVAKVYKDGYFFYVYIEVPKSDNIPEYYICKYLDSNLKTKLKLDCNWILQE
jgi:hypothetical protein